MLDIYREGFQMLWAYQEFRIIFGGMRYLLLVILAVMMVIAALHSAYLFGHNSWLYRRRSPCLGWSRRFFIATSLLCLALAFLYWLSGRWIDVVA